MQSNLEILHEILSESTKPTTAFAVSKFSSLHHRLLGAFPSLKGGEESLIYFREIAKKREQPFIDDFIAQTESDYVKDLLGQAWRNSQILKMKFDHLTSAFNLMALAIVPWLGSLVLLTIHYPSKGLHF